MNLNRFSEPNNFLQALKALFKDLKVPMNYVADEPATANPGNNEPITKN